MNDLLIHPSSLIITASQMGSRLKPLIKLFYNPTGAMADLQAHAPYLAGAGLALAASIAHYALIGRLAVLADGGARGSLPGSARLTMILFFAASAAVKLVLLLAVVFVPACLLAASLIDRRASFRVLLRQEYAPLAACILYGWAAAQLAGVVSLLVFQASFPPGDAVEVAPRLLTLLLFAVLVTFALRAVLRLGYGRAVAAMALGALSLLLLPLLPGLPFLFSSPLLLILLFILLRNFFGDVLSAQRSREEFRQNLQAATLNPADASAHYNLGLIYQQRGQYEEAKDSFRRAIEIDPTETDAHYQLGRIAREQGRLSEAVGFFDATVQNDAEHSQSEVWREIGRAYFEAGQYADARAAFERFLARRPSDAEGRYRYGMTLHRLGEDEAAAVEMRACVEAVRNAPAFKYRTEKQWMNEAQSFLRSQ